MNRPGFCANEQPLILMDFESWGSMREGDGLSIEAARDVWMSALGRMLVSVPLQNPYV
jgi:hypothetical protein